MPKLPPLKTKSLMTPPLPFSATKKESVTALCPPGLQFFVEKALQIAC
jgi:hypothetical protein